MNASFHHRISKFKKAPSIPYHLQIGVDYLTPPSSLQLSIGHLEDDACDFLCTHLFHGNNFRDQRTSQTR